MLCVGRVRRAAGAAEVEDLALAAEDDRDDPGLAGEPADRGGGEGFAAGDGAGAELGAERVEGDGDHHGGGVSAVGGQLRRVEVFEECAEGLAEAAVAGDPVLVPAEGAWVFAGVGEGVEVGQQPVAFGDGVGDRGPGESVPDVAGARLVFSRARCSSSWRRWAARRRRSAVRPPGAGGGRGGAARRAGTVRSRSPSAPPPARPGSGSRSLGSASRASTTTRACAAVSRHRRPSQRRPGASAGPVLRPTGLERVPSGTSARVTVASQVPTSRAPGLGGGIRRRGEDPELELGGHRLEPGDRARPPRSSRPGS